jgi:hypothetical protein
MGMKMIHQAMEGGERRRRVRRGGGEKREEERRIELDMSRLQAGDIECALDLSSEREKRKREKMELSSTSPLRSESDEAN